MLFLTLFLFSFLALPQNIDGMFFNDFSCTEIQNKGRVKLKEFSYFEKENEPKIIHLVFVEDQDDILCDQWQLYCEKNSYELKIWTSDEVLKNDSLLGPVHTFHAKNALSQGRYYLCRTIILRRLYEHYGGYFIDKNIFPPCG